MRTSDSKNALFHDWDRKMMRVKRRLRIRADDVRSDLNWHLGGGRQHFNLRWREIAASHRWVFIIGCNNSGTSLLQRLLEWTGQVSTFPAEGQLYTRAIARDRNRAHARVWTEYLDQLQLLPGTSLDRAPRLVHDWMTNLPEPIRPVIVEKTPVNTARALWLQEVFPNSRFIGLVRNGYAVTEGIRRKAKQPLDAGARHWSAVNKLMLDASRGLDGYLEVSYEELAERPAETILRICRLIGIESDSVAALANAGGEEGARAMSTVFGPVRNRNPESMARLSSEDRAVIQRHAGEMLEFFGYGSARAPAPAA